MYRIQDSDDSRDDAGGEPNPLQFKIAVLALERWEKMIALFLDNHPHLEIVKLGGEVYTQNNDGSITVSVRGTTLKMKIREEDWSLWEK